MKQKQIIFICNLKDFTVSRIIYYSSEKKTAADIIQDIKKTMINIPINGLFIKRNFNQALDSILNEYENELIDRYQEKYGCKKLTSSMIDNISHELLSKRKHLININNYHLNYN